MFLSKKEAKEKIRIFAGGEVIGNKEDYRVQKI